ncbi:MAG: HemK2/MTQ2 family protein methyltransferase [Candidatus Anstonellales archaeon]
MQFEVFPDVYEPAEDSFMLAEHAKKLKGKILEIGTGCGIVALTNALHNKKKVEGCDVNKRAVENAEHNAKINKIKNAKFFVSNLFSSVPKNKKYDWIVFNPPYLPTAKNERIKGKLNAAFDGGRNGRKTLDRFLEGCRDYLKKGGGIMLISSSLNDHEKTVRMLEKMKFEVEILEEKKLFFEKLYVIKAKLQSTI